MAGKGKGRAAEAARRAKLAALAAAAETSPDPPSSPSESQPPSEPQPSPTSPSPPSPSPTLELLLTLRRLRQTDPGTSIPHIQDARTHIWTARLLIRANLETIHASPSTSKNDARRKLHRATPSTAAARKAARRQFHAYWQEKARSGKESEEGEGEGMFAGLVVELWNWHAHCESMSKRLGEIVMQAARLEYVRAVELRRLKEICADEMEEGSEDVGVEERKLPVPEREVRRMLEMRGDVEGQWFSMLGRPFGEIAPRDVVLGNIAEWPEPWSSARVVKEYYSTLAEGIKYDLWRGYDI